MKISNTKKRKNNHFRRRTYRKQKGGALWPFSNPTPTPTPIPTGELITLPETQEKVLQMELVDNKLFKTFFGKLVEDQKYEGIEISNYYKEDDWEYGKQSGVGKIKHTVEINFIGYFDKYLADYYENKNNTELDKLNLNPQTEKRMGLIVVDHADWENTIEEIIKKDDRGEKDYNEKYISAKNRIKTNYKKGIFKGYTDKTVDDFSDNISIDIINNSLFKDVFPKNDLLTFINSGKPFKFFGTLNEKGAKTRGFLFTDEPFNVALFEPSKNILFYIEFTALQTPGTSIVDNKVIRDYNINPETGEIINKNDKKIYEKENDMRHFFEYRKYFMEKKHDEIIKNYYDTSKYVIDGDNPPPTTVNEDRINATNILKEKTGGYNNEIPTLSYYKAYEEKGYNTKHIIKYNRPNNQKGGNQIISNIPLPSGNFDNNVSLPEYNLSDSNNYDAFKKYINENYPTKFKYKSLVLKDYKKFIKYLHGKKIFNISYIKKFDIEKYLLLKMYEEYAQGETAQTVAPEQVSPQQVAQTTTEQPVATASQQVAQETTVSPATTVSQTEQQVAQTEGIREAEPVTGGNRKGRRKNSSKSIRKMKNLHKNTRKSK